MADPSEMQAWKLRAGVYAAVAVTAALVLWQRGAFAGEPPAPEQWHGTTSEGSPLLIRIAGDSIAGFDIARIRSRCSNRGHWSTRWYPSIPQSNVTYRRTPSGFEIHEGPRPDLEPDANLYMRGRLTGSRVTGTVWYTAWWPGGVRCTSDAVTFSAKP